VLEVITEVRACLIDSGEVVPEVAQVVNDRGAVAEEPNCASVNASLAGVGKSRP
jgi:hypothetical protein